MRYLSVCSGIEAASVAWEPMGWTPVGFSEIEPFPCSVLKQRYPNVPNFGDMTKHESWEIRSGSVDVLVGGTPCQSFSVAGRRGGLEDARGKLMLAFLGIAERLRPRFIVWENVPGVLSSNDGKDFGTFLGALGNLGYGWGYRILDAQWCRVDGFPKAVPQRRRRIFLVGCLGDGERAAQILFEQESVQRDYPSRRKEGENSTTIFKGGIGTDVAATVTSKWAKGYGGPAASNEWGNMVFDAALNIECRETAPTLTSSANGLDRVKGRTNEIDFLIWPANVSSSLGLNGTGTPGLSDQELFAQNASGLVPCSRGSGIFVRRITPRECERLQGFPDDWTLVTHKNKLASDGPRYKAIGNSIAVNVMRWLGGRIENAKG